MWVESVAKVLVKIDGTWVRTVFVCKIVSSFVVDGLDVTRIILHCVKGTVGKLVEQREEDSPWKSIV